MQKFYTINNLYVDPYLKDFLLSNHNKINRMILCVETLSDVNFLSPSDKADMISYLPKNKKAKVIMSGSDPFSAVDDRARMKVGRLIGKLFSNETLKEFDVSVKDIEEFVNAYKSFFNMDKIVMKIVEGVELKKWYLYTEYAMPEYGTLWKSCMRYEQKQAFLEMYEKNPDVVKMLVMLQEDSNGQLKLRARALLWQEVRGTSSTLKVMDRIYTIYDSDVFIMKKWAIDNGYICKKLQNAKSQSIFEVGDDDVVLNLSINLQDNNLNWYPYLDTFQFYDIANGVLYNYPSFRTPYQLNRANGLLEDEEPEDEPTEDLDFEDW